MPESKPKIRGVFNRLGTLMDRLIPEKLLADPEQARRARMVNRFGFLGAFFGVAYATFYLVIGHKWGVGIILVCSSGYAVTPFLMRRHQSIKPAGHFLALILTLGFSALCFVEGGLQGHAIAWLVSVPLCSLLLLGQRSAIQWAVIAFLAASVVAGLDLVGIKLPVTYDPKWTQVVTATGYLGLIIFMFILGLTFENSRAHAAARMQDALVRLETTNERLVHLNNEKTEFLGIAAHDLKNPLTVIAGSAEMLTMTHDKGKLDRLANVIGAAATRMRDLITNLLDVNAIEQGKFSSNVERCDVRKLVEQTLEHNQMAATKKSIAFQVGTSEGLWARADRAATLQILDNLISNALKYSPPNTTVYVHTLPETGCVLVAVRDEGPGISEADQKKMFQKFSRLSARPTGGESSTGLGLAIVKRLAEAMSGSVQCHSVLGAGSTFTLRLPVWTDPPLQATAPAIPPRDLTAISNPWLPVPGRN